MLSKCNLFEFLLFSSLIFIIPKLLKSGTFTAYNIESPVELIGVYEKNTILNGADHLYENLIKGPESIVEINGELYTGVHDGEIIKLSNGRRHTIAKFGNVCNGYWEESKCGRPFGLTTDKSRSLYVADAYYGIWKVNVTNGAKQCLVSHDQKIGNKISRIFNGIAVDSKGDVYWTDSSTDVDIQNGVYAMFLDGSGRLVKYSPHNNSNEVIVFDLSFPNGLAISPNEDFVIVSEMSTSRLLKVELSGKSKGKTSIFLDKLPGFPDNLKVYKDYIVVPLVHSRDLDEPILFQYLSPYPFIRRFVIYGMALVERALKTISIISPGYFFDRLVHMIGHFESVSIFAPTRVTVLIVNWSGQVVEVWHSLDGSLEAVSDVLIYNHHVYFGSPYNSYIGHTKMPNSILRA